MTEEITKEIRMKLYTLIHRQNVTETPIDTSNKNKQALERTKKCAQHTLISYRGRESKGD